MKTKTTSQVGIIGYGAALPVECVLGTEIERGQQREGSGIPGSLGVVQKTVPAIDEDTITLSTAAAAQSLERCEPTTRELLGALFIGSESHPYAVKPSGTVVANALGLPEQMALADLQFACKAGTQSVQIGYAYVKAGICQAALVIGADTAQARPGDVLEFTAGAGAAAFIVGSKKEKILAEIEYTTSVVTDTPDFWRRPGQPYPEHAGRFSGEPAYFAHIEKAAQGIFAATNMVASDFDYCVFHTPNAKFPKAVAKQLGFTAEQLAPSLIVSQIGNTYAAASLLGLVALLDVVDAHKRILVVSYGSGAGSDAFVLRTTEELVTQRKNWHGFVRQQIDTLQPITYTNYLQRGKH